jgi:hypothetical protein
MLEPKNESPIFQAVWHLDSLCVLFQQALDKRSLSDFNTIRETGLMKPIYSQQFQIQKLMPLEALHQEDLTILDNRGDRFSHVTFVFLPKVIP